ncbi:MAG: MFS transporter, partial [Candidatus Omnitrophica bacterium]|nr:MFS transporter [Candidatus Omnitrophota bacterium]
REDRIPFFQKFIYSIGSMVNDSQAAWIGQMVAILILGLGISPIFVGLIGCIPRVFDAVLDPIVGFSSDNARTKYGRRRPFIFFGAIFAGICYMLMFQLYKENSTTFNGWYFLIFQILFFAAFTCYSIPWIALGYEMTPDYHERTNLQSWSRVLAQIPWLVSPWCWAIMYNKNWFSNPETGDPDPVLGARTVAIIIGVVIMVGGILPAIFNKEHFANLPKPKKVTGDFVKNFINDARSKLFIKPLVICTIVTFIGSFFVDWIKYPQLNRILVVIACILLEVAVFLLLNAIPTVRKLFKNIAITFRNKLFVKICASTFLIFNGFMLSSSFILFVIFFYVFQNAGSTEAAYSAGGKLLGVYGTFSAICTVCVVSFIPWLSRRLGKRNAFFVTIPISIIGYAMKWIGYNQIHPANSELWTLLNSSGFVNFLKVCALVAREHYLLLACAPFIVFGLGSLFTIILSMVADVCDQDELETGERREGMFSAVYWWMVKLGMALASLIGGILLVKTGFRQEVGIAQPVDTLFWMRVFDVLIPIVTSVIAIFIIMTIDDSEEKAHEVRRQLEERRGKA